LKKLGKMRGKRDVKVEAHLPRTRKLETRDIRYQRYNPYSLQLSAPDLYKKKKRGVGWRVSKDMGLESKKTGWYKGFLGVGWEKRDSLTGKEGQHRTIQRRKRAGEAVGNCRDGRQGLSKRLAPLRGYSGPWSKKGTCQKY